MTFSRIIPAALAFAFLPLVARASDTPCRARIVAPNGDAVAGARVAAANIVVTTGQDGAFVIPSPSPAMELVVTHPRYKPLTTSGATCGEILELQPLPQIADELVVTAIRADDATPVTKKDIGRGEIDERYQGQDMPLLLSVAPSMTAYSDSGSGTNYSYVTLRGIGQTRINMTLDGVPLNDPAENAFYFNNITDFAGAVDSIQVQRGVGTSTVGSPSYGGSINFTSMPFDETSSVSAELTAGSYGTTRASAEFQSGQIGSGFALWGRASYNETDGYRDHSGVEQHSLYLNGSWRNHDSMLKLVSIFGREKSQMSYLAVDEPTLETNPTFNPLDESERDDFGQDIVQLQYTKMLGRATSLTATAYYNGAHGFFELWGDPVTQTALLRFNLDQQTTGLMATVSSRVGEYDLSAGAHYADYDGDHFQTIDGAQQYFNTGFKTEVNSFVKASRDAGRWNLYGDAQLRHAEFSYEGDIELGRVDWTFFNPKVGARYRIASGLSAYASVGQASREPTRNDLLSGEDNATVAYDLDAVDPERVTDFEAGIDWNGARHALAINLFAMEFDDEIALTGELSDIGLPLRRNVDESYRRGIEVDFRWVPNAARTLELGGNATLSRSRISTWTQFTDVYGEDGSYLESVPVVYRDVEPVLTPSVIANVSADWLFRPGMTVGVSGRYVGESQLDNTGNARLVTPDFTVVDFRASFELERWLPGRPRINVFVNNLFDNDRIYASGYSYQFFSETITGERVLDGIPYYYPSATRNVMATIDFRM
ncbi:MAG: TonB-dependent receptor [Acidobacteria bacterium]|nr:TonB-dependent receptor [Acidobacteriota bacterium]